MRREAGPSPAYGVHGADARQEIFNKLAKKERKRTFRKNLLKSVTSICLLLAGGLDIGYVVMNDSVPHLIYDINQMDKKKAQIEQQTDHIAPAVAARDISQLTYRRLQATSSLEEHVLLDLTALGLLVPFVYGNVLLTSEPGKEVPQQPLKLRYITPAGMTRRRKRRTR